MNIKKFVSIVILIFALLFNSKAQIASRLDIADITVPIQREDIIPLTDCNSVSLNGCNYIYNNTFTPLPIYFNPYTFANYTNPFNYDFLGNSLISGWDVAHGTPTVYDGINYNDPIPPPNASGYFFGASGFVLSAGGWISEGVVQKIPTLTPNNTYTLSLYKMLKNYTGHSLDHFKIVLLRCQDYMSTFWPMSYQIPPLPAISQTIYCETSIQNIEWNQIFIKFTSDYAYDMIWIYPEGNHDIQNKFVGIFVSFPELINVSNFNAGSAPNPTPPNCNVTIGPTTPNCGPTGAVYKWYGPNNQIITAPQSQQIQVDASDLNNTGVWTLGMLLPNAVSTNNTCSEQQINQEPMVFSQTINVPFCQGQCTTPFINPIGPIDYYYFWESEWIGKQLTSSATSGNQWYRNNVAIPNAVTSTYNAKEAGNYYVKVETCTSNIVSIIGHPYYESPPQFGQHIIPVAQSPGYYCLNTSGPIKLFNLGSSANYTWNTNPYPWIPSSLTINPSTYNIHSPNASLTVGNIGGTFDIQGTANLSGEEKILDYHLLLTPQTTGESRTVCANSINYFGAPAYYGTLPGSTGFTYETYDFGPNGTIVSPALYAGFQVVTIPGNSPLSNNFGVQFSGNSYFKFDANYFWGGCYSETPWNITVLTGCFDGGNNSLKQSPTTIYPNPATDQLSFISSDAIKEVEIFSVFNNLIFKIKGNNSKTLTSNIANLPPGLYNCRITTIKNVENQKLIIKR
ncbi:MAG TPA: T9SS type A sorting domain-containing protein [Ferruginibacter sp.]|nr:T9SS type A sorting domain-containing protein [Ferruginibacter sp.]